MMWGQDQQTSHFAACYLGTSIYESVQIFNARLTS